jgi:hypothetical protein
VSFRPLKGRADGGERYLYSSIGEDEETAEDCDAAEEAEALGDCCKDEGVLGE